MTVDGNSGSMNWTFDNRFFIKIKFKKINFSKHKKELETNGYSKP